MSRTKFIQHATKFPLLIVTLALSTQSAIAQVDGYTDAQSDISSQPGGEWNYPPSGPYLFPPPSADCSTSGPMYFQPSEPMIQPSAPLDVVPLMPVPGCNSPLSGPRAGPIFVAPPGLPPAQAGPPNFGAPPVSPLVGIAPGGMVSPQLGLPAGPEPLPGLANPMLIPVVNDELAWEQIADVVSDYFTIAREQQARRSGDVWSEGRIETAFQSGATWLEPHRDDSVGSFNRWESTFQTIRRLATIRVIPDQGGYLVEVIVQKELEDMPRPEHATAGAATLRNDSSLPTGRADVVSRTVSSPRWIPLGRDAALETRLLAEIHARTSGITTAGSPSVFAP
jgi:hypothetical protein